MCAFFGSDVDAIHGLYSDVNAISRLHSDVKAVLSLLCYNWLFSMVNFISRLRCNVNAFPRMNSTKVSQTKKPEYIANDRTQELGSVIANERLPERLS